MFIESCSPAMDTLLGEELAKRIKRLDSLAQSTSSRLDYLMKAHTAASESDEDEMLIGDYDDFDDSLVDESQNEHTSLTPKAAVLPAKPRKHLRWDDISLGAEPVPVPAVNIFDDEPPPPFIYTTELIDRTRGELLEKTKDFCSGCSCIDGCGDACPCRQLSRRNEDGSELLQYECNSRCACESCPESCTNRQSQGGIRVKLELFKTMDRGWGVRAMQDIPKGTTICQYTGEVVVLHDIDQMNDMYLLELDTVERLEHSKLHAFPDLFKLDRSSIKFNDLLLRKPDHRDPNFVQCPYCEIFVRRHNLERHVRQHYRARCGDCPNEKACVDGNYYGNVSRFFNHSCDPNVGTYNVMVETHDLRLPSLAFITRRHVKVGEELCWDYHYQPEAVDKKLECRCGAKKCRGWLLG
eukprot:TRINITY_DN8210_c0_g1_i4.p1 TRINITY_DN8210_c0_g1~~TRINITY_DN8210_c0_g1_i4.p1  ORF type:complete len:410 (+),score=72.48 TRINITY_DN8210_c0_g1_i4:56-1285(+)